jgi:hypothetical protein
MPPRAQGPILSEFDAVHGADTGCSGKMPVSGEQNAQTYDMRCYRSLTLLPVWRTMRLRQR